MKTHYFITCCSAFLLISSIAYSQTDFRKGYMVTLHNDTLRGLVDHRSSLRNSQICTFKLLETAAAISYKPEEIKAYYCQDLKLYESKIIKVDSISTDSVFLEAVVKGRVNLYFYKGSTRESFFMSKDTIAPLELTQRSHTVQKNGETYIAETKPYLGTLSFFMNDHAGSMKKISNTSLDYKSLYSLTHYYNSQFESKEILPASPRPARKMYTGPLAGVSYTHLKFHSSLSEYQYLAVPLYQTNSAMIGWFFRTNLNRASEKLSLQIELLYMATRYHTVHDGKSPFGYSFDIHYDVVIRHQAIKLPVMMRYTYPRGPISPFIQAGIANAFTLGSSSHFTKTVEFPSGQDKSEGKALDMKPTQQSLLAGIGLQSHVLSRTTYLEARMEKGNGINMRKNGSALPYSRNTSFQLIVSMAL